MGDNPSRAAPPISCESSGFAKTHSRFPVGRAVVRAGPRARRQQARSARREQRDACEDQIERAVRLRVGDAGSDDPTGKRTAEDLADNEKDAEESHGRRAHVRRDLAGDDVARGRTQ
jgi:hypothetical protein